MAQWKKSDSLIWQRQEFKMKPDHTWTAPPGHKIFVADRGAVQFNYPATWIVVPTDDAIELHDEVPPKDDCLIKVSVMYLAVGIDWSGLSLPYLLEQTTKDDERGMVSQRETIHVQRDDVEFAWYEKRFMDPVERREACDRALMARRDTIMPFITMDFWPEHTERFGPVWDEILRSLQVGGFIADPTRGPRRSR